MDRATSQSPKESPPQGQPVFQPRWSPPAWGWGILVAGTVAIQMLLCGPSLAGRRVLAPTDVLLCSNTFLTKAPGPLGVDPQYENRRPQNALLDPVQAFVPWLDFAAREVRAGRLPLWNPYSYCGSPFLANMQSAVFSPFTAIYYLWPDPRALAWIQLVKALLASLGTYGFLRALGTSRWAALVGGWCYPNVGFLVAWLCFPLSSVAVWLPWTFWATTVFVQRPSGWAGPLLSVVLAILMVSGHLETAAHIMLSAAFVGVWQWVANRGGALGHNNALRAAGIVLFIGLLAAGMGMVQIAATLDYVRTSFRVRVRQETAMERGYRGDQNARELARLAFPYLLGTEQGDSLAVGHTNFNEGGTNGYAGFTMLCMLAPIGIVHGWRRSETWMWVTLGLLAAAPMFRVPILDLWDRVPPLNMLANTRALMLTGWAVLVLGVRGLDSIGELPRGSRWIVCLVIVVAVSVAVFFGWVIAAQPAKIMSAWTLEAWPWFRRCLLGYSAIASLGSFALLLWLTSRLSSLMVRCAMGTIAVAELVWFAWGYNPQVSRETFYPQREFATFLAERIGDGRICGLGGAFYPNVSMMYGLRDIRGYDAVDPTPYVELLRAITPGLPTQALTWQFMSGPSPVLDMLGVRYIIAHKQASGIWEEPVQLNGLWIYHNPRALPRVFVPRRVTHVPRSDLRLKMLTRPDYDPRALAILSDPFDLSVSDAQGTAELTEENPCRVIIRVWNTTESVVVLSDAWASGWRVSVDGKPARALQANHALRAVHVPAGEHVVEWRYEPLSVRLGLITAGASLIVWTIWCCVLLWNRRNRN